MRNLELKVKELGIKEVLTREQMKQVKGGAGCNENNASCAIYQCYNKSGVEYCVVWEGRGCPTTLGPMLQVCNALCAAGTTAYNANCNPNLG